MSEILFELKQLTYRYPDGTTAIKDINLTINKGKKIALLGNNGAGKSTLFLHLNGILKPSSGRVLLEGCPVQYDRRSLLALRKKVGIVFQNPDSQLFSGQVKQDIAFGPINLGWPKEKVKRQTEWAMKEMDVTVLQDRPIHFLSLGQKKRVSIAGILAMEPEVFIFDEPTAGLDPLYAKQIKQVLKTIQNEEKTILLSTHDVHFAYEWADEIIVITDGTLLYQGHPVSLFHKEDILEKAHLEKPWVFETAQVLMNKQILTAQDKLPRSKEELYKLLYSLNR